eukprot:TRINITY_DN3171_c2_g1_i2.p1 TRINITY_DN3171_c2_g1~~TRINITY_DN3171_c2_g1_i2.p1  ORF type:complete len:370 (-),score=104.84 TRINITY_DN3171_c2_g1_i2:485-1570(-)
MSSKEIWTIEEDEIIKAAVLRYGMFNWGKISSFLPNKTSKECQARFTEYLDPTIQKDNWTAEEDEKLIRLVKVLPNSWRAIAAVLDRPANICHSRYLTLVEGYLEQNNENSTNSQSNFSKLFADSRAEVQAPIGESINLDTMDLMMRETWEEAQARLTAESLTKKQKRRIRESKMQEKKQKDREQAIKNKIEAGEYIAPRVSHLKKRKQDILARKSSTKTKEQQIALQAKKNRRFRAKVFMKPENGELVSNKEFDTQFEDMAMDNLDISLRFSIDSEINFTKLENLKKNSDLGILSHIHEQTVQIETDYIKAAKELVNIELETMMEQNFRINSSSQMELSKLNTALLLLKQKEKIEAESFI